MPFDIQVGKAAAALDPDLSKAVKTNRPAVAKPTGGPNRHTIFVPSEATTFSLGEKCPERIDDVGITGRTDNHVHFHVQTKNKTVVSLGGPATEVTIDAFDAKVPKQTVGYAMVTDDVAWHDSKGQHYMVSREGDVVLRAHQADAMLQSDAKTVHIVGGSAVDVSAVGNIALTAHPSLRPEDKTWNKPLEGAIGQAGANKYVEEALKVVDLGRAAFVLGQTAMKMVDAPNGKESGWKKANAWEKAKFLVDIGKLVAQAERYAGSKWGDQTGKIKITGKNFVSVTGGVAAGIYGGMSASLSSWVSASVLGGTAALTGLLWTSVWSGAGTSVKSLRDVSIEGENGKATVKGKKGVELSSKDSGVTIQGKKEVTLSSTDASTYMHGAEMVFMGAGSASGWGLKASAKKNEIHLGKVASGVKKFDNPGFAAKNKLFMKENQMDLLIGESKVSLKASTIKQETSGEFDTKAGGNVKIKGAKILLG